jgi:hypothetical protein
VSSVVTDPVIRLVTVVDALANAVAASTLLEEMALAADVTLSNAVVLRTPVTSTVTPVDVVSVACPAAVPLMLTVAVELTLSDAPDSEPSAYLLLP